MQSPIVNHWRTFDEYIKDVKIALTKFHIDDNDYPTINEVVLMYVCQMFEDIYYNNYDNIYLIDVYIINRFYRKVLVLLSKGENTSADEWNKLWELSASKIIKYSTQRELDELAKWFAFTEDVVLGIISNCKHFDYITKYDKKLTNCLFNKYINTYINYYANFNNITTEEEANDLRPLEED